jgi:uncharacterized protein YoaH (UPF0181 family)
MSAVAELVQMLMLAGMTPEQVARAVDLAEQHRMSGGMSGGNPVDTAAERRREWDRDRKRRQREAENVSGGNPVESAEEQTQKERSPTPPKEKLPLLSDLPSSEVSAEEVSTGDARAREAATVRAMVDAYNEVARAVGWSQARHTKGRVPALRARLKDAGGLDGFRDALAKARASPFLTGENDRGWRADLDFLLQARSFNKLMEGGYDAKPNGRGADHNGPKRNGADAFLRGFASVASDAPRDRAMAGGEADPIPSGRFNIDG